MRRIHSLVVLLLTFAARSAVSAQGAAPPLREIQIQELSSIAARVSALRVVPRTLAIRVGQTIQLDSLRVIAVDVKGHDIGRLRGFNFAIKPGEPAVAVPRQITGARPGKTELRISYPSAYWGTRLQERPAVAVPIIIKP